MKIVVLDGYTENPGDLSWGGLEALGELKVYDRTPVDDNAEIIRRIGDAQAVYTNKTPVNREIMDACPNLKFISVLATGYNGVPSGLRHCEETGGLREQLGVPSGQRHEICRGLHAEQNAIIQAARYGIDIEGSSIYITTEPCSVCAKMLINAGIKEIVFATAYPDKLSEELLGETDILIRCVEYSE